MACRHARALSWLVLGLVAACGDDEAPAADAAPTPGAPADAAQPLDAAPPDAAPTCTPRPASTTISGTVDGQALSFAHAYGAHIGGDCDVVQVAFTDWSVIGDVVPDVRPGVVITLVPPDGSAGELGTRALSGWLALGDTDLRHLEGTAELTRLDRDALGLPVRATGTFTVTGTGATLGGAFDVDFCALLSSGCI